VLQNILKTKSTTRDLETSRHQGWSFNFLIYSWSIKPKHYRAGSTISRACFFLLMNLDQLSWIMKDISWQPGHQYIAQMVFSFPQGINPLTQR
jgi:hypothetical protein